MNEIGFEIGSWTFAFSTVEMLFHTLEASFFMFIVFVVEAVHSLRVLFNGLVSYRVDIVSLVLCSWNL